MDVILPILLLSFCSAVIIIYSAMFMNWLTHISLSNEFCGDSDRVIISYRSFKKLFDERSDEFVRDGDNLVSERFGHYISDCLVKIADTYYYLPTPLQFMLVRRLVKNFSKGNKGKLRKIRFYKK